MKKFFAACFSLLLLIVVAVPCYAAPQREIVSETTTALANGIECTTTIYWEASSTRASTRKGGIDQSYSYDGKTIAIARLTATFTYNGSTATAISASGSHSTASGWSYSGQSTWCSGATAHLTATVSGPVSFPVNLSLTCSPSGVLS
ncbi:hypothetical protein [uncultured Gemmiger sp.]|uniref:hypothetical protein n=1 Tax=uncultured Gemmiger sp. TaxID=1623490 RepID=UPI0025CE7678|nr:hypothetical protein [uncultured Gemmiger sp.]